MDESVSNVSESVDVGAAAAAATARDRSGGAPRFADALRAARAHHERETEPPVELHLSAEARKYVGRKMAEEDRQPLRGRHAKQLAYPPRDHGESDRHSHSGQPDSQRRHDDD